MLWLDKLSSLASGLLQWQGAAHEKANLEAEGCGRGAGGRLGPGCVYRGAGNCPPFRANPTEYLIASYSGDVRPCYDINVSIETMYQFIPVITETTRSSTSTSLLTTTFETVLTTTTSLARTTESRPVEVFTTVTLTSFSDVTVYFTTVVTALGTTTTVARTVTGSVNVGNPVATTVIVTVPFATLTDSSFGVTRFETTQVFTSLTTTVTSYLTDAFAAAITIGPEIKDWSYFHNACANITYDGDGSFVGGPLLSTNSTGQEPLFISSNKRYRLYPCETMEIGGIFHLNISNPQNVTSPLGYESDPAYGAGLLGAFDLDTGFSFYIIATMSRAYAMYSRVPSWCPCVNMTLAARPCGSCAGQDRVDDQMFPIPTQLSPTCNPCGDEECPIAGGCGGGPGACNPCGGNNGGACASHLYQMQTQTYAQTSTTTTTTTTRPAPPPLKAPRRPLEKAAGFDYYAFTYLIPIDYLVPGEPIKASVLLNKGAPSVTWTINGKPRLTITSIGAPIDPRFLLGHYGGSASYTDFPEFVQLALGLLSVTESTDGRTACQGGVYEECYQGGQSPEDARWTFCNRAAIQNPGTYNLTALMDMERFGVTRITKTPRPCCPNYA